MELLPKDIIRLFIEYLGIDAFESFSCTSKFAYNALTRNERRSRTDIRYCVENNKVKFLRYFNVSELCSCAIAYNVKILDYLPKKEVESYFNYYVPKDRILPDRNSLSVAIRNSVSYNHIEHLKAIPKQYLYVRLEWLVDCSREILEYIFENDVDIDSNYYFNLLKAKPSVIKYILENQKNPDQYGFENCNYESNFCLQHNFRSKRVIKVLINHIKKAFYCFTYSIS